MPAPTHYEKAIAALAREAAYMPHTPRPITMEVELARVHALLDIGCRLDAILTHLERKP